MPQPSTDNLTISATLKKKLKDLKDSDPKTKAMKESQFVSYLLEDQLDFEEKLKRQGAFFECKAIDNEIFVRDNFRNKTFVLRINAKERELYCEGDERTDCIHVGFAFANREVYERLIAHGFKPPKIS